MEITVLLPSAAVHLIFNVMLFAKMTPKKRKKRVLYNMTIPLKIV
jgi:hypothetical protein